MHIIHIRINHMVQFDTVESKPSVYACFNLQQKKTNHAYMRVTIALLKLSRAAANAPDVTDLGAFEGKIGIR